MIWESKKERGTTAGQRELAGAEMDQTDKGADEVNVESLVGAGRTHAHKWGSSPCSAMLDAKAGSAFVAGCDDISLVVIHQYLW